MSSNKKQKENISASPQKEFLKGVSSATVSFIKLTEIGREACAERLSEESKKKILLKEFGTIKEYLTTLTMKTKNSYYFDYLL